MDLPLNYEDPTSPNNVAIIKQHFSTGSDWEKTVAIQEAIALKLWIFDEESRSIWDSDVSSVPLRRWAFTYLCYRDLASSNDWEKCFQSKNNNLIVGALNTIGLLNLQHLKDYALRFADSPSEDVAESTSMCLAALKEPELRQFIYNPM